MHLCLIGKYRILILYKILVRIVNMNCVKLKIINCFLTFISSIQINTAQKHHLYHTDSNVL